MRDRHAECHTCRHLLAVAAFTLTLTACSSPMMREIT
jgi:hypothetical protein